MSGKKILPGRGKKESLAENQSVEEGWAKLIGESNGSDDGHDVP